MPLEISITIYVESNCLGWSTGFVIVTTGKRCLRRSRHIITVLFSVKTALVNYSFASEKSLRLSKDSLSMIFPTKPLAIGNNIARAAISYSNYVRMKQFKPVEFREGSIWLKPKSLAIVSLLLIFQSWLLKEIMAATDNRKLKFAIHYCRITKAGIFNVLIEYVRVYYWRELLRQQFRHTLRNDKSNVHLIWLECVFYGFCFFN